MQSFHFGRFLSPISAEIGDALVLVSPLNGLNLDGKNDKPLGFEVTQS